MRSISRAASSWGERVGVLRGRIVVLPLAPPVRLSTVNLLRIDGHLQQARSREVNATEVVTDAVERAEMDPGHAAFDELLKYAGCREIHYLYFRSRLAPRAFRSAASAMNLSRLDTKSTGKVFDAEHLPALIASASGLRSNQSGTGLTGVGMT